MAQKFFTYNGQEYHFGWKYDKEAIARTLSQLAKPNFEQAGAHLRGSGEGKDVFFFEAEMRALKTTTPMKAWDQGQLGSCVAHGSGRAAQDLLLIQIALGNAEEWEGDEICRESIYAGSRIQVGHSPGGEGSVGSWAAEWLNKWGIVWYGNNGVPGYYDVNRCRQWGDQGVPDNYQTIAKQHPIKTMTQVTSANDARDALANGYPISICGTVSRSMTRQPGGWCPSDHRNAWPHCFKTGTIISGFEFKAIEDVKVGDKVFGHDGKLHKVLKTFKHLHSGNFITINVSGLPAIEVTDEHPFLVDRNGHKEWII